LSVDAKSRVVMVMDELISPATILDAAESRR
jgi:hypothetical protein